MTARRQSIEYARCLSLYPSQLSPSTSLVNTVMAPSKTRKKSMHEHTHTYKHTQPGEMLHLEPFAFSPRGFDLPGYWQMKACRFRPVTYARAIQTLTLKAMFGSSFSILSQSVCVCMCVCVLVHLHWQFLLAWCADPSSTPTVNPVRPGVILTLTFGRWTRDVFFSPSSRLTHSHPLLSLSFPQSHPSIRKSMTQYYSDIMGPLTALLK